MTQVTPPLGNRQRKTKSSLLARNVASKDGKPMDDQDSAHGAFFCAFAEHHHHDATCVPRPVAIPAPRQSTDDPNRSAFFNALRNS